MGRISQSSQAAGSHIEQPQRDPHVVGSADQLGRPTRSSLPALHDGLIDLHEVCRRVGFSPTTIYKEIRLKRFPAPVRVFNRSRWHEAEVRVFIDRLPRTGDAR